MAAVILHFASPAAATWSIVAVDAESGLVGGAMASCIQGDILGNPNEAFAPLVLVPGRAAGVAQGNIEFTTPSDMRVLLQQGSTPEQTIEALLENDIQAASRQFGVVSGGPGGTGSPANDDTEDEASELDALAYMGSEAAPANGVRWSTAADAYSVQGVSLADPELIEAAAAAFEAAREQGQSLDRAMVDALVAGSAMGGDERCPDQTALFAHVAVAEPDDNAISPSLVLTVLVDRDDGQNPVRLLDQYLDEGRTGWIDVGRNEPSGLPQFVVLVLATLLGLGAFIVIRQGLGNRKARR